MSAAADWTVDELMVTRVARIFADGDQVVNGMASFIPVCAYMLARRTHAPDLAVSYTHLTLPTKA